MNGGLNAGALQYVWRATARGVLHLPLGGPLVVDYLIDQLPRGRYADGAADCGHEIGTEDAVIWNVHARRMSCTACRIPPSDDDPCAVCGRALRPGAGHFVIAAAGLVLEGRLCRRCRRGDTLPEGDAA